MWTIYLLDFTFIVFSMIRLRELLQQVIKERKERKKYQYGKNPTANSAEAMALEKKPGFGNYGPAGQNLITHRSMKRKNPFSINPVTPHRIGQKPAVKSPIKPVKPFQK